MFSLAWGLGGGRLVLPPQTLVPSMELLDVFCEDPSNTLSSKLARSFPARARARTRARLGGVARLSSARVYARPPLPGADCECLRRPWRAQKEDASKDQNALHRLFVAGQVRTRGVGQLAAWMEGPLVGSAWRDSFGGALCECGVEVQARSLLPVAACHEQGWFAWCTDGCPAWLGRKGPEK